MSKLSSILRWMVAMFFLLPYVTPVRAQNVTTSQYDNARTGANLLETRLTPANVNANRFGKLFSLSVDGDVYAEPLFLEELEVPGKGRHDVLLVATEHDSVYAFDASHAAAPLWKVSLLKKNETTIPEDDLSCPFIAPEVGITSSPVIDVTTGTLYVLVRTKVNTSTSQYKQRLHALDVRTGIERSGSPVDIHATVAGKGAASKSGKLAFDPLTENPRASLLLVKGSLYLTWASSCDVGPYHGWVMAYDARSLRQKAVFNASPDADSSGFWASDTGPAADQGGNIILATGNGRFDAAKGGRDYGDSLLKLDGQTLLLKDYFTPFDADRLNSSDSDLGSGGPLLLPTQPGPHPRLIAIAGKAGVVYLVSRDRMGHYQPQTNSHAVQTIPSPHNGVFGGMAYWNHNLYVLSDGPTDVLRQFAVEDGHLSLKASSGSRFPAIDATPTISANGSRNGILWVLRSKEFGAGETHAVLSAFDATDSTRLLYTSEKDPARDQAGFAMRFNIPTVANGRVYFGAQHEIDIYGLLDQRKAKR